MGDRKKLFAHVKKNADFGFYELAEEYRQTMEKFYEEKYYQENYGMYQKNA